MASSSNIQTSTVRVPTSTAVAITNAAVAPVVTTQAAGENTIPADCVRVTCAKAGTTPSLFHCGPWACNRLRDTHNEEQTFSSEKNAYNNNLQMN